tara:strand:- start:114 stop:551 length:438 start_codon:yes stop_codon:yes gene_type:complete
MNFYLDKYALIVEQKLDLVVPENYDVYEGSIEECFYRIKAKELKTQQLYNGNLFVKNISDIKSSNENYFDLESIEEYELNPNSAYFKSVQHSGPHFENSVDADIFLCNGWNLPCIVNAYRTKNTLYGNLKRHRVKIFELKLYSNI